MADAILGATQLYNWRGVSYPTYYSAGDGGPWTNSLGGNALQSLANVDKAEELLSAMSDPNTGEPILSEANAILVSPARRRVAGEILHGSTLGYTNGALRASPNPFGGYAILSSRVAQRRLAAAHPTATAEKLNDYWYIGDFSRAFAYMENWPITVSSSGVGSEAEFSQDVVARFKASERGAVAVLDPRRVVRCFGA
ncbi:MAG: hypothetical protein HUK22_01675 [Thermoguttaceae bacterium]|nr:hypothetical protein [Thermoguttaceae bacterium]